MKKTLSIVLALFMILSVCSFSIAAAPEGTAVTSEAEFLAMAADGNYYLANDITVTKSYEALFTGTLDGNGKTVTVSAPMFANFAGTAKNIVIAGEVSSADATAVAALAATSAGGTAVVLENIVNNATVTGTGADAVAGGLIGQLGVSGEANGVQLTVTNCVNNGTITGSQQTGGLVGVAYFNAGNDLVSEAGVTLTNCVNNGKVTGGQHTGGIIGRALYTLNCVITGCVNNAEVLGGNNTGGIIGHTTSSALYMSFCQNNAFVSNFETPATDTTYAGGLLGYGQGTKVKTLTAGAGYYANKIEFCINNGDVLGAYRSGGIASSVGASGAFGLSVFNYCVNTGNVTSRGLGTSAAANSAGGILGYGYGSSDKEYACITNCITTGNIESKGTEKGVAAYFLAYINSPNATIANNQALGTLTSACGNTFSLGWNNKSNYTDDSVGNKLPAGCSYNAAYESEAVSTRTFDLGTTDELVLKSGALVFQLNTVYKALTGAANDVVYMTVDGTFNITLIPAVDDKGNITNAVVLNADGTYGNPKAEPEVTEPVAPETTEPAPETTEPPVGPATGDSFVIFAVIAVISVLGVAVVAKRREN